MVAFNVDNQISIWADSERDPISYLRNRTRSVFLKETSRRSIAYRCVIPPFITMSAFENGIDITGRIKDAEIRRARAQLFSSLIFDLSIAVAGVRQPLQPSLLSVSPFIHALLWYKNYPLLSFLPGGSRNPQNPSSLSLSLFLYPSLSLVHTLPLLPSSPPDHFHCTRVATHSPPPPFPDIERVAGETESEREIGRERGTVSREGVPVGALRLQSPALVHWPTPLRG